MSKFFIGLTTSVLLTAVALPSFAQTQESCAQDAKAVEQVVRSIPDQTDQAIAQVYVLQAEKAAQAHDERACRDWLARVDAYSEG